MVYFVGAFGPIVGAILASLVDPNERLQDTLRGLVKFKVSVRWYMISVSVPIIAYGLSALLTFLLAPTPDFAFNSPINALAIFVTLPFVLLGEEVGWRGFALQNLQKHTKPLRASILIGLMWTVWHIPAFFVFGIFETFQEFILAFAGLGILCISLSIILSWVVNSSGGSVFMAVLNHSAIAAVSGITNLAIKNPIVFFSFFILTFLTMAILVVRKYGDRLGLIQDRSNDK